MSMERSKSLHVQVRLYSHLRLAMGKRTLDLDLPGGATVSTVMERLRPMVGSDVESMIVDKERGGYRLVALVNGHRAGSDVALREGDVVSLLPPLGGG